MLVLCYMLSGMQLYVASVMVLTQLSTESGGPASLAHCVHWVSESAARVLRNEPQRRPTSSLPALEECYRRSNTVVSFLKPDIARYQ